MTRIHSHWSAALVAFAGIAGAAGVVLAALAAHHTQNSGMVAAANILLIHAAAAVAIAAWARTRQRPTIACIVGTGLLLGASIFAAAVALPALGVMPAIPRAAPAGGMIMICAWIGIALVAIRD